MTRKMLLVVAAFTMLFAVSGATAPEADAQTTCTKFGPGPDYYATIVTGACPSNAASASTGTANTGGSGGSSSGSSSAAAASTGAAGTGSSASTAGTTTTTLAVTGAENGVLGYVGAGLVGFGALALGAARRRQSDLA